MPSMRGLVACPFCREMFEPGERRTCSVCGVKLVPLDRLPPKTPEASDDVAPGFADEERLPLFFLGRGRGALVGVALAGIVAFALPWIQQHSPEPLALTGPDLASKLGWMWAPLVAWMVMIPLVLSRRNVYRMRGARVAVAFLAAMVLLTAAVRGIFVPTSTRIDPVSISLGPGLYLSAALAVIALGLAARFGGPIDDLPSNLERPPDGTVH
jgi:hypothetical protein